MCGQVLRNVIEKIEKKERDENRRMKKQELEEEKHKRVMVAKLQGTLFKHKEALKKEILKKRSIMEKNLQQEIQVVLQAVCVSSLHGVVIAISGVRKCKRTITHMLIYTISCRLFG